MAYWKQPGGVWLSSCFDFFFVLRQVFMWLRLASDSLVIHKDAELLILLLLPPKYWNYRFVLICMDFYFVLFGGEGLSL